MEDRLPPKKETSQKKLEETAKRYWKSEKGKGAQKRYSLSPKGKDAKTKYLESELGKAALLRYYLSEKGIKTRDSQSQLRKLLIQYSSYLEENPDKTIEDFLTQLNKEE